MKGMDSFRQTFGILVAVMLMSGVAGAAIINVPADQPTIIAAVTAAGPGDEIRVAAGTYSEAAQVNFATSNVTLTALGTVTLQVPSSADSAVVISGGATGVVIRGLNIVRTTADSDWRRSAEQGGNTSATWENCTFTGPGHGVGLILFHSADAIVRNCTFSNFNSVTSWGGAIALEGSSGAAYTDLLVENCYFGAGCNKWIAKTPGALPKLGNITVRNSRFTPATHPMGIYIQGNIVYDPTSSILFEDCVFEGTGLELAEFHYTTSGSVPQSFTMRRCEFKAYNSTRRLMYYDLPTAATFENCLFAGGKHEAVIRIWGGPPTVTFLHCTMINDGITSAESSSGVNSSTIIDGWDGGRTFVVRNSLFYSPTSYSPALAAHITASATRTYNVAYSIVDHAIPSGVMAQIVPGPNYSNAAIQFVNPSARNYRQTAFSPGVETGTNLGIALDLDRNPRFQGIAPDMGAYESSFTGVQDWVLY